jgi:hypothetical protein
MKVIVFLSVLSYVLFVTAYLVRFDIFQQIEHDSRILFIDIILSVSQK